MGKKKYNNKTVIHLEYKGENYYYGSIACIFDYFTSDQLGITYNSLKNYGLSKDKPYVNSKCIIRKGQLVTKERNI